MPSDAVNAEEKRIRDVLVDLYPTEISQRRIVNDAGLDDSAVRFVGTSKDVWFSIFAEARKHSDKLEKLIHIAYEDGYRDNEDLLRGHLSWITARAGIAISQEDRYSLYCKTLPPRVAPEPKIKIQSFNDILGDLWDLSSQVDDRYPVLEFVVRLIHHPDVQRKRLLEDWIKRMLPYIGEGKLTEKDVEKINFDIDFEAESLSHSPAYLQVEIAPDSVSDPMCL